MTREPPIAATTHDADAASGTVKHDFSAGTDE